MKDQDLEIINVVPLVLKHEEKSSELKLTDPDGDSMYVTIILKYINEKENGKTLIKPIDPQHALIEIETLPNALAEPAENIKLGTYNDGKPIFMSFVVQPQIAQSGQHNVLITFLKEKEAANGTDNN